MNVMHHWDYGGAYQRASSSVFEAELLGVNSHICKDAAFNNKNQRSDAMIWANAWASDLYFNSITHLSHGTDA